MSIIETLAVLYGGELKHDPSMPGWEGRDRLVMSKGHAGPAVYATLCLRGYFGKEKLRELNQGGGSLPSHCDMHKTPGIDMTTGSLGQGMSTAIGIAYGQRMNRSGSYTFLVIGDGECNEGQVWEGAMFAAHNKLGGLIAFVDWNKQQLDGFTKDILDMGNIAAKWESFGWYTQEVDGHNIAALDNAVEKEKKKKERPSMIVMHTIKGKGCNFAEGVEKNHSMAFDMEKAKAAIAALEA
jgi:transketolase